MMIDVIVSFFLRHHSSEAVQKNYKKQKKRMDKIKIF